MNGLKIENLVRSYLTHRSFLVRYVTKLNKDIIEPLLTITESVVSTPNDIYYTEKLMQYADALAKPELELYIWWTVVEQLIPHAKTPNEMERTVSCLFSVCELMDIASSYILISSSLSRDTLSSVSSMFNNIREAFQYTVQKTSWLDDISKRVTSEMSSTMKSFIVNAVGQSASGYHLIRT